MYEEHKKVEKLLQDKEQEKIKREMEACTFKPAVSIDPVLLKDISAAPVWERLQKNSNDKKQILEEREKLKERLELEVNI